MVEGAAKGKTVTPGWGAGGGGTLQDFASSLLSVSKRLLRPENKLQASRYAWGLGSLRGMGAQGGVLWKERWGMHLGNFPGLKQRGVGERRKEGAS